MSVEENVKLRDLVTQTLELNGCLPKIRALLRASIFLAFDEEESEPLQNKKIKNYLQSETGKITFCLVREFLEFLDLDFTISVYETESYMGTAYQYNGRSKLIEDLGLSQFEENPRLPLLPQLIELINVKEAKSINNVKSEEKMVKLDISENTGVSVNGTLHSSILNETFNISNPTINLKEETSSSSKDQIEPEFSPPIVKDKVHLKYEVPDKFKIPPQKVEKLKSKSNLSSLVDLPPLQLNKSRNDTMLLPSLYSKEFKANQNLKELDKLFDLDSDSMNNYEEDFISESEVSFSKNTDISINGNFNSSNTLNQ